MEIKLNVSIKDDQLSRGLVPMLGVMPQIEKSKDDSIILEFDGQGFITPVFVMALIVFCAKWGKKIKLRNIPSYLKTVKFNEGGMRPDKLRFSEFIAQMQEYYSKSYIPIISFSPKADNRDFIISTVEQTISSQAGLPGNVFNAVKYIISESVDNIADHSDSKRGYIFSQVYKQKGFLDLCIADTGITLLGSYNKMVGNGIDSDIEAIQAAQKRVSSKNKDGADNRGYGIYTSRKMIVDGLGGQYLMISGSSIYIKGNGYDNYYSMPNRMRWEGTIIALRIPLLKPGFNYINYFE